MQPYFKNYKRRVDKNMHQRIGLTDEMVHMTFHCLCEGFWDRLKQTISNNTVNNLTVTSLIRSWEDAGSPSDSQEIIEFLTKHGIDKKDIEKVYTAIGIPTDGESDASSTQLDPISQIKSEIEQLTTQQQLKLMTFLKTGNSVDLSKLKTEISNLDTEYQQKLLLFMKNRGV